MSAHMCVRVPPRHPEALDVMGSERVEQLVWNALFDVQPNRCLMDPDEALSSTDHGMTGGLLLHATGDARVYLEGALAVLRGEEAADLRKFLAALDEHGALLITKERN